MNEKPVALVTGAAAGIGRRTAVELAYAGYSIAAVDIVKIEEFETPSLLIQADISSLKDHHKIIDAVFEKYGRIDVLVNNAGVAPDKRMDILDTTPESFDRVMAINSRGTFFLTQRVAREMIEQVRHDPDNRPSVIFISSISAVVSSPSRAEYCISKAAVSQMARVFAHRLAQHHINVYEVRPGIIRTGMTEPVKEKYDKLIAEGLIPQKRWGFPQDVARAVVSLAQGAFSYSTGMVLEVSGGMDIRRL